MLILQHFHPQGSHLLRTVVEAGKIFSAKLSDINLVSIVGANFLNTCFGSAEIIQSMSPPLKSCSILHVPENLTTFEAYLRSHDATTTTILSSKLDSEESNLLDNSIRDSLYRGLSGAFSTLDLYISCDGEYFKYAFRLRRNYAYSLFNYYSLLLGRMLPDIVTISHGNYDYYITLYLAARSRSIPVLIVNGGFNRSWVVKNKGALTDHSSSSEKMRIFRALTSGADSCLSLRERLQKLVKSRCARNAGIEAHQSSASNLLRSTYRASLENKGIVTYVLMMPILGEVCHQDLFFNTFNSSKPAWLHSLFSTIAELRLNLVIRHHPEVEFYSERNVVRSFLDSLASRHSISITHLYSNTSFSHFIRDTLIAGNSFVPLSFGSSISSELATFSLSSITANGCLAALIPSATIYEKDCNLLEPRPALLQASYELENSISHSEDMRLLLTWIRLTGKYYSTDRVFRQRSDLHIFFGRQPLMPKADLQYTLQDYFERVRLQSLEIGDCLHLFTD